MSERLFKTNWVKFSDYEISYGRIKPKKGSKMIHYDPIAESEKFKKSSNTVYDQIYKIKEKNQTDLKEWLRFAKKWGLPNTLLHNVDEIILAPRYLPFQNSQIPDVVKDHITRKTGKVNFVVHNFEYEVTKLNSKIQWVSEKNKKLLNKYRVQKVNYFESDLNPNDPTDLNWPYSNVVHLCPQQLIYKYFNGKWEIRTNFLTVKKLNKKAKPGDIIDKNNVIDRYLTPGYFKITDSINEDNDEIETLSVSISSTGKRKFNPFYLGKHFISNYRNIDIKTIYDYPDEFTKYFPGMLQDETSEEKHARNIEEFFWPFPDSEKFHRNYAEEVSELMKLAIDIKMFFLILKDTNKKIRLLKNKNEKKYSIQYNNIYQNLEKSLIKFTSRLLLTFSKDEERKYSIYSPSLIGYIGHIILQDITSKYSPRFCVECERLISNPAKPDSPYCDDSTCGNRHRVRRTRKKAKLKKLLDKKEISKKVYINKLKEID